MNLVVIESPYAGDVERNLAYARRCLKDSLSRGEAPYASHLLYTQVLDDSIPEERHQGIVAGFEWGRQATYIAVYTDYGTTSGMQKGIDEALARLCPVMYRTIGQNP